MLSYAEILDRVETLLQDSSNATYDVTELGYWIEDELKRISRWKPLLVDVVFQIESRRGTDATGTASYLTDSVKSQFLSTDPTKEKVVHNTTDDTWAVVTSHSSTSILGLSRDIMDSGEKYEIYNKRCKNSRQIYIGDMPPFQSIVYVEYPIGTPRNFFMADDDIIELNVYDSTIMDSDSTLSNLNPVDVLVRFAVPQILSQLTDWTGELTADAVEGATSIAIDGVGNTEIIEVGEQFTLESHRSTYFVTTAVTTGGTGTVTLSTIYPPLEAASPEDDDITFKKSTLNPQLEEILCQRVAARAMLSNTSTKLDNSNKGGPGTYTRERQWAMDMLEETEKELKSIVRARPAKILPRT